MFKSLDTNWQFARFVTDDGLISWYFLIYSTCRSRNVICVFVMQVVNALHYLQAELKVIHRDVKPSNILINRNGQVKMCDFGISGNLVDSVAKTIDAGCKPYMAVCRTFCFRCCLLTAFAHFVEDGLQQLSGNWCFYFIHKCNGQWLRAVWEYLINFIACNSILSNELSQFIQYYIFEY